MGYVGDAFTGNDLVERLPGDHGHRPHPLFHRRRQQSAQRPADVRRSGSRRRGHRSQRQPDQLPHPARTAGERGLDLPVHVQFRGDPSSHRPLAQSQGGGSVHRRPAPNRGRLRPGGAHQQETDRRARSAGHPAARAWGIERAVCAGVGNLRPGHDRRALPARHRPWRIGGDFGRRDRIPAPLPAEPCPTLRVRVRLLCPPRQRGERPLGLRGAKAHGPAIGPGMRATSRCGRARSQFRRAGRPGLFPSLRRAVRDGDHPQPLCGPDLHPADPRRARTGGAHEAQPQPRGARRQAGGADRQLGGARHDLAEDRAHGARGRSDGSPSALGVSADHVSGLLRHRHARTGPAAGRQSLPGGNGPHFGGRQPGLPVRGRAILGHGRGRRAIPPIRSSPIIISPATIPPACWTGKSPKGATIPSTGN